jgi:hypothetical protein
MSQSPLRSWKGRTRQRSGGDHAVGGGLGMGDPGSASRVLGFTMCSLPPDLRGRIEYLQMIIEEIVDRVASPQAA